MGQLFDCVGRLVRAELNSGRDEFRDDFEPSSLSEGSALVAGGAIAGASIGKVGVLAVGAGYSVGAVPLAAVGALAGAALYEALRSLLENDASSMPAAAVGAVAGAATSVAMGGVGVAVGGTAIGVGMASMAAGGAVIGLGLAGLSRLLQQGIDPEMLLDSAIEQMETDSHSARQALTNVIASQKRFQQQYNVAQAEVNKWQHRAQLALQQGNESLARDALARKKMYSGILSSLEVHLNQEPTSVKNLKRNLILLENKISEAKALRTRLKAQIADFRLNKLSLGTKSALSAFDRMEDRVLQMEARSQAAAELAEADIETQFAELEAGGEVDDELAAMKAQLVGAPQNPAQLLGQAAIKPQDPAVDAELEALRNKLDRL